MRLIPASPSAIARTASTTIALLLVIARAPIAGAQARDSSACRAASSTKSPAEWLSASEAAVGMDRHPDEVLRLKPRIARDLADQSDRPYPPFVTEVSTADRWYDPRSDVERSVGAAGGGDLLQGPRSSYRSANTTTPAPQLNATTRSRRNFNPWTVLADWSRDPSVRVLGRCRYADFDRIVLVRRDTLGPERLFIDPRSAFPMKLDAVEMHYFLGPIHDEYRYTSWSDVAPFVYYPASTIKLTDGLGAESWFTFPDLGLATLVPRDSAPSMTLPDTDAMPFEYPPRFSAKAPDTVRVGKSTFLLVNPAFTDVVSLVRDTIFLFDAPGGEERARADSVWIGSLYPGRHPVTLVLLSHVWPHIAGLRFWTSTGARLVVPKLAKPVIEAAVARRWTERPDRLEHRRGQSRLRIIEAGDSLPLANGSVRLYALDGAGNEGTLMAYLPADRFLWASDRVQAVSKPSLYTVELARSVKARQLDPEWTSGPHFQLVPWSQVEGVAAPTDRSAAPPSDTGRSVESLGAFLIGAWRCNGGTPVGRHIQAEVTFAPAVGARWLRVSHRDLPPGRYASESLWPVLAARAGAVSTVYDNGGGTRRFVATEWTSDSVRWVHDSANAAGGVETFTYRRQSTDAYWYAWHVQRSAGEPLALGDSATCTREQ